MGVNIRMDNKGIRIDNGVGLIMGVNIRISNILFTYIDRTWAKGPGHRMCAKY